MFPSVSMQADVHTIGQLIGASLPLCGFPGIKLWSSLLLPYLLFVIKVQL